MFGIIIKLFGEKKVSQFYCFLSAKSRLLTSFIHEKQMKFDWSRKNEPRWFNHFSDQFFQFRSLKSSIWLERGVFNCLVLKEGSNLLELGCGDGFNAFHFYSPRCATIKAVDFDEKALQFARKYNSCSNVKYEFCDILIDFPSGLYDNIIWDGSIEQFNESQINKILLNIKKQLSDKGIFSGYTAKANNTNILNLSHNKREFISKEDLKTFLNQFFSNVTVIETCLNNKCSFYFFASNDNSHINLFNKC